MATGQPMYPPGSIMTVPPGKGVCVCVYVCGRVLLDNVRFFLCSETLRLTFVVRDGILVKPFQLEHGRTLIQVPFHLKDSVQEMLMQRLVGRTRSYLPSAAGFMLDCMYVYLPRVGMIWSYSSSAITTTTSKNCATGPRECQYE